DAAGIDLPARHVGMDAHGGHAGLPPAGCVTARLRRAVRAVVAHLQDNLVVAAGAGGFGLVAAGAGLAGALPVRGATDARPRVAETRGGCIRRGTGVVRGGGDAWRHGRTAYGQGPLVGIVFCLHRGRCRYRRVFRGSAVGPYQARARDQPWQDPRRRLRRTGLLGHRRTGRRRAVESSRRSPARDRGAGPADGAVLDRGRPFRKPGQAPRGRQGFRRAVPRSWWGVRQNGFDRRGAADFRAWEIPAWIVGAPELAAVRRGR